MVEQKLATLKPVILLLDLSLPDLHGQKSFAEIQKVSPSTRIILLTKTPTETEGTSMLEAGAKGYCSTEMDPVLLVKAVKMVQKRRSVGRPQGHFSPSGYVGLASPSSTEPLAPARRPFAGWINAS